MSAVPGMDVVRSFLVVAKQLNFRRSAERLDLDQSALTRRVQKLAETLGYRLLDRSTGEVALTPRGGLSIGTTPTCCSISATR